MYMELLSIRIFALSFGRNKSTLKMENVDNQPGKSSLDIQKKFIAPDLEVKVMLDALRMVRRCKNQRLREVS